MPIARRRSSVNEIPQTSLADMAFLLLIFFIASTTFAIEQGLPLVLPSAQHAVLDVKPGEVLRIEGHADNQVFVEGNHVHVEDLGALIRRRNAARRAAGREELVILIETDPQADYRLMVDVLDQVRQADSRRVALKQLGRS